MVIENKKGYLKTVEAIIALLILFSVVLYSISARQQDSSSDVPQDIASLQSSILKWGENDRQFREAVFSGGTSLAAIYAQIKSSVPDDIGFSVVGAAGALANVNPNIPDDKDVYLKSTVFFNETGDSKTVLLYMWRK